MRCLSSFLWGRAVQQADEGTSEKGEQCADQQEEKEQQELPAARARGVYTFYIHGQCLFLMCFLYGRQR